jgi:hypothetical protein
MKIDGLSVVRLDEEARKSFTHGPYKWCVLRNGSSWTAFMTDNGIQRWAWERNLKLPKFPDDDTHQYAQIEGHYIDDMTFEVLPDGIPTKRMDNGEYTKAILTIDDAGIVTVHFQNPNVKDRVVYSYNSARQEMS